MAYPAFQRSLVAVVGVIAATAAHAELVYDTAQAELNAGQSVRVDDRSNLREVMNSAHKAQTTRAVQAPAQQVQIIQPSPGYQVVQPAPVLVAPSAPETLVANGPADVQNMGKAELLRRERVREELKNEDIIQERLEQLRLRDEQSRTDKILGKTDSAPETAPSAMYAPQMEEVTVAPPATQAPGQSEPVMVQVAPAQQQVIVAPAPRMQPQAQYYYAPAAADQLGMGSSSVSTTSLDEEKTHVMLIPRAGLSSMGSDSGITVSGRYSAGLGIDIGASENMLFQIGYLYSEYGVRMPGYSYYGLGAEQLALNQNVFDAGLKFYLLNTSAKIRPFVGGGAGYSMAYLNYDSTAVNYWRNMGYSMPADYEMNQFLGILSAGLDVKINKSINVGAVFKYHSILSSSEKNGLDSRGFYGPQAGYSGANTGVTPIQSYAGASLARSSFYSILAGVSFTF